MDVNPVVLFVQRLQGSRHHPQACHDPVFRQITTKPADQHCTLPDHQISTLVEHQHRLLLDGLHGKGAHCRSRHCLADRFGIPPSTSGR